MILDVEITKDEKTGVVNNNEFQTVSPFDPSEETKAVTERVMKDFMTGNLLMNQTYREFNDLSVLDRLDRDKAGFNTYLPGDGDLPMGVDSWKSQAMRPIERNRSLDIAAQVSARTIFPAVFAQNENDEEDRKSARIMRYLMQWSADQSDYERTQLYSIIGSLYSPASITHTEYTESFKKITVEKDGETVEKMVLDEENSGFKDTTVPVNELFIENIYEHSIQKQGFLIWRRLISRDQAFIKYGKSDNWKFVSPGLQTKFDPSTSTFYDIQDDSLPENLVEELIYWRKQPVELSNGSVMQDVKLTFVNGIPMVPIDHANPRIDKKYPFTKFGFELVDEGKFFYYKSVVFKMQPDARNINDLWRMVMDGTYLSVFPPMMITGNEEISSDVIAPGAVTTVSDPTTQITPIQVSTNFNAAYNGIQALQEDINATTSTPPAAGIPGQQTAFEIATLQQNALVNLGLFAKMIGFMVKDYGQLRMSDIVQYMTIGEAMNVVGDDSRLNFRKFLLPEESIDGKTKTVAIEFDMNMPENASEEEIEEFEMGMMKREAELDNNTKILKANPTLFRTLKFTARISPELLTPPNEALMRQQAIEAYTITRPDPNFNSKAIGRDILLPAFPQTAEDPDKYMAEQQAPALAGVTGGEEVQVTASEGPEGEAAQAEVETAQLTV